MYSNTIPHGESWFLITINMMRLLTPAVFPNQISFLAQKNLLDFVNTANHTMIIMSTFQASDGLY